MADYSSEKRIEILQSEAEHVAATIRAIDQSGQKIMALAVTVLGLGLAYGVKDGVKEILVALPIVLFGVASYGVHTYTEVVALGGYRRYLEETVNSLVNAPTLRWESAVSHQRHGTAAQFFLYLVYGLVLAASVAISLHTTVTSYGSWCAVGLAALFLVLAIGLVVSLRAMYRAFDRAYKASLAGRKDVV